jgi:hypothetical protein
MQHAKYRWNIAARKIRVETPNDFDGSAHNLLLLLSGF